jgi:hypothetical protein
MATPPVFRPAAITTPLTAPTHASSIAASRPWLPRPAPELAAWQLSSLSAAEVEIERLRTLTRLVDAANTAAAPGDAVSIPSPLSDGSADAALPQARQATTEQVSTL